MPEITKDQLTKRRGYMGSTANMYMQYVDRDLQFTPEEMLGIGATGFRPMIELRIAKWCDLHRLVYKRVGQLPDVTMENWWASVQRGLKELLAIYPGNFTWEDGSGLPLVTEEEMGVGTLPSLQSKEGKALTLRARALDEQEWDWIHGLLGEAHETIAWVATMQERQGSEYGWNKNKNSNGNKFMNKLHAHELRIFGRLRGELISKQDRS